MTGAADRVDLRAFESTRHHSLSRKESSICNLDHSSRGRPRPKSADSGTPGGAAVSADATNWATVSMGALQ
ncbi:unnamed protein product [Lampetra planeri]